MINRDQIISPRDQVIADSKSPVNHLPAFKRIPVRELSPVVVLNVVPLMKRALKLQPRLRIRVITDKRYEEKFESAVSQRAFLH